jgi:hypothetical protein
MQLHTLQQLQAAHANLTINYCYFTRYSNYKLRSVAHLPWRMMVYKALNTFIDDLFAFIMPMPTLHRLACFRDDIIFFAFLYQKWLYRTDMSRSNEFGRSYDDAADADADTADVDAVASAAVAVAADDDVVVAAADAGTVTDAVVDALSADNQIFESKKAR